MGLTEPAVGVQRRERLPGHGGFELDMKVGVSRKRERGIPSQGSMMAKDHR